MHYLNTLLAFITHHPGLAYGAIFIISLSESLALVGLLVPGTVIMFGVGAIVATGSLSLFPVLLMAMIGAIAGDGISYWLGHHYKERLVNIWPFSRYPGMLNKGESFFHRHGGKSVLFGRFVGPVRPVIPVVAGMLGMRPVRFSVVNILSAIGWALVYILPGVFFGASLAVAGTVSTRLAVLVLIFVAGIWSLIWISRKTLSLLDRKGPAVFASLKQWTTTESLHLRTIVRPVKRLLALLIFREQGEEVLFAFLTLLLFAAGWGFLGVLQDVLAKDPLVVADQAVYHFLQSLRTPWADNAFVAVTELGDSFVNIALFCTVLLVLLVKRCHRAASFWALTVLGGLLAVQVLKWTIHLPRPVSIYDGASAFSFPSGHTTMSVVLYGFLAILIVRQIGSAWRWGLVSSVVLIAFIIGFSRLYLGAHWLSDVLGGYFIGTSWATIVGIAYLKKADKPVPKRLLAGAVIGVVLIVGGWHVTRQHKKDLSFYAPRHTMQTMALASWLTDGWRDLPAYRIDLAGEKEQPLTIQWVGSTDELTRYLLSKQWQTPSPLDLKDLLRMLSPDTPIGELPVLPRLHNGRIDVVRLVQPVDETRRWVLRLWPTDLKISENGAPVFEGTIEVQNRRHLADMILLATDSGRYGLPLTRLTEVLNGRFTMKLVNRKGDEIITENEDRRVVWHGGVLLIRRNAEPDGVPSKR
ncbi:bifunctional DedA family/phosphatase PAP2 family protein [Pelobacter seleniigenes]|uniref:bifunctional DedA family/phosphatase PAP2 family protein n=1 Tax=Pelobacter seleniigenes TaxID=407188 RepID=UPI00068ECA87|nr:bifunctional DedA family/phosphatase PAP2 family protein [Pelobacter seleniigenes]